jgi:hypothetical protein
MASNRSPLCGFSSRVSAFTSKASRSEKPLERLTYFLAIPVYSMYGAFTESGLPAHIMQLEFLAT